jgi:acyl-CoA synthetase (AMP-forming)/AMP-acid ligase II
VNSVGLNEKPAIKNVPLQNVADLLRLAAQKHPDQVAVAHDSGGCAGQGKSSYDTITFRQLNEVSDRIALGLQHMGVKPGTRLALLVPPGLRFIALVYGLFKSGATIILIDPGMGRRNMIRCLSEARPEGFVAIPLAHVVRCCLRRRFPKAKLNVTIGRRWFWGGATWQQFQRLSAADFQPPDVKSADAAAIIFTTGSTGPSKGVLYQHDNFIQQAQRIRDHYQIAEGGADLSAFPLFALFNAALGKTTIIPDMDATRPADAVPQKIIGAINDWQADQSFGSPALWNTVGRYCVKHQIQLPSLRRVLSAGAPVPEHVLRAVKQIMHPEGEMFTPYGATEALPVASNSASCILHETSLLTRKGAGTCVGNRFEGIRWRVIEIHDGPLPTIEVVRELPPGEIGELMVQGPVVTREYVTRTEANALHKVRDGEGFWHRMGDVGYLDDQDRFWFCGRKGHRVRTTGGTMYTIPSEAIFNNHAHVYRSALVGVGDPGKQTPVIIIEPWPEHFPRNEHDQNVLREQLQKLAAADERTQQIRHILIRRSLPVDIRHNAKIFREQLAGWAASRIKN